MSSLLARLAGRALARRRVYSIFESSAAQRAAPDSSVQRFDARRPPSAAMTSQLRACMGRFASGLLLWRLRAELATLLVLPDDAGELAAYGWIQDWAPLRREFGWLARDAICLGPYWTRADLRRRGLYGRLLSHSLDECNRRFSGRSVYIWARRENVPSVRAIAKAGFAPIGDHEVCVVLGGLFVLHRELAGHQPAIGTTDGLHRGAGVAASP